MRPSELRERILYDHETLRAMLVSVERVSLQVIDGESRLVGPLRFEAETLLEHLLTHMSWEDQYLRPALLEADAWGRSAPRTSTETTASSARCSNTLWPASRIRVALPWSLHARSSTWCDYSATT